MKIVLLLLVSVFFTFAISAESVTLGVELKNTSSSDIIIKKVTVNSVAALMGLLEGDIVIECNDKKVKTSQAFARLIMSHQIGDEIKLTVMRKEVKKILLGKFTKADALNNNGTPKDIEETLKPLDSVTPAKSSMEHLSIALNELPKRINQAAKEFKKTYPEGEFVIDITIRVLSDKKAKEPIKIQLGEAAGFDLFSEEVVTPVPDRKEYNIKATVAIILDVKKEEIKEKVAKIKELEKTKSDEMKKTIKEEITKVLKTYNRKQLNDLGMNQKSEINKALIKQLNEKLAKDFPDIFAKPIIKEVLKAIVIER